MDETGIMEGYGLNGLILGYAEKRKVQGKQPDSRTWTTIIECNSATGVSILPAVIYKGKSVQKTMVFVSIRQVPWLVLYCN